MDAQDVMMQAFSTSEEDCAVNVIGSESNGTLQYSQIFDVKVPKANKKVLVDAGVIKKIQLLCAQAKTEKFPFAEVFLGVASLFWGAFLSALISGVSYEASFVSILSYNVCPVGGVGFGVAYFFCRKKGFADMVQLATRIEECICDSVIEESEE